MVDYFAEISAYARSLAMKNVICIRPEYGVGISGEDLSRYAAIETIDNVGTDPYWNGKMTEPYPYVRKVTETCLASCAKYVKEHHLWIQGYGFLAGREEEIVEASDAAYDGGARTILTWSYRSGDACDFQSACPEMTWRAIGNAMGRLQERHRDERLAALRKEYA